MIASNYTLILRSTQNRSRLELIIVRWLSLSISLQMLAKIEQFFFLPNQVHSFLRVCYYIPTFRVPYTKQKNLKKRCVLCWTVIHLLHWGTTISSFSEIGFVNVIFAVRIFLVSFYYFMNGQRVNTFQQQQKAIFRCPLTSRRVCYSDVYLFIVNVRRENWNILHRNLPKKKNDFKVHTFTENLNSSELKTCYSFCFFSTYDSFIHQTPPKCSQDSTCSEWRAPFIDRCNFDRTRDNLLIIMSGKKSASRTLTTIWLTDKKDCECDSWQVHAMHIIISSFF